MTKIMELANKNIKTALVNMLHIIKKVEEKHDHGQGINEKILKRQKKAYKLKM